MGENIVTNKMATVYQLYYRMEYFVPIYCKLNRETSTLSQINKA